MTARGALAQCFLATSLAACELYHPPPFPRPHHLGAPARSLPPPPTFALGLGNLDRGAAVGRRGAGGGRTAVDRCSSAVRFQHAPRATTRVLSSQGATEVDVAAADSLGRCSGVQYTLVECLRFLTSARVAGLEAI